MISEDQPRPLDDTAPCLGCGLCCDGTIFSKAVVTPGEEPRLLEHGLELTADKEPAHFILPCHYASCGKCTNYQDRFDICRSFRCDLLKRYQAGAVDLTEARATVETALALVSAVRADGDGAVLYAERRTLRAQLSESLKTAPAEEKRGVARRLLNIIALDEFLQSHFRRKKKAVDDRDGQVSA